MFAANFCKLRVFRSIVYNLRETWHVTDIPLDKIWVNKEILATSCYKL